MAHFGIQAATASGISIPTLRQIATETGTDPDLAQGLWESGVQGARILAAYTDNPIQVSREQMKRWVADSDSWEVCDQVCPTLFDCTR
nr:DNA alkylation repair protein [Planctomycetales bacterium]